MFFTRVGSYTLSAVATDNYGINAISGPINLTVKPGELEIYYIDTDQLGTPRVITDTSDNVVWQWDNSDPFGNNSPNENPTGAGQFTFPLRFAGQYFDRETNTHYNINRDYDPATGRYVESDPVGLRGGVNTYTYVEGNPINRIDHLALFDLTFNAGFHLPISPGVAVGPVFSSLINDFSNNPSNPLVSAPTVIDVEGGAIADAGTQVGVSDMSYRRTVCWCKYKYW